MLKITEDNKIIVPKGIRYISDWKDYNLSDFPFPHILDKKIPGCGYTEYCITSNLNVILCSPRKILLENKEEQHPGDVYYFRNKLDYDLGTDKDISRTVSRTSTVDPRDKEVDKERLKAILQELKTGLNNYITRCIFNDKPAKILVTYDSFRLVKEILEERKVFDKFHIVVDEMQSVFTDSTFKSDTELGLLSSLQGLYKLCFVSATPMIDKYLRQVDEFKDLPYYELDWETEDPLRVVRPDLKVRSTNSISSSAEKIINKYKEGKFEEFLTRDGRIISNEAVFYVNSVTNIISIIKKCELKPDEVNILCANTHENSTRIKKRLNKKFEIGKVPLKGEKHKMFTFCTRTVYLGADFYSTCARTFILSDANIETLTVDITLDLPQILGRQRLVENPWKNRAELYYKTLRDEKKITKEDFDRIIERKLEKTESLLRSYNNILEKDKHNLAEKYLRDTKNSNYKYDYVAVDTHSGNDLVPKFNNLVLVSQQRAFDIQQIDYKDRFTVFNTVRENKMINDQVSNNVISCLNEFNNANNFPSRMRMLCEYPLNDEERHILLDQVPIIFKMYYEIVGPGRCKALSYNKTEISRELENIKIRRTNTISEKILEEFRVGERYSKSDIKQKLGNIYSDLGYNKTAKANDLEEYFELRTCQITNKETGKRDHGFEIVKRKD